MKSEEIYNLINRNGFSISTDTRTLSPGDIYIGIKGENFDGNEFILQALEKGASYVITNSNKFSNTAKCLFVKDTRETLEELAKIHRNKFSIPILAIGGSNGKTTTKELVSSVLSKKYKVHTTKGNFNNDIGVPLTILAMPTDTEIAVIEIGANHPKEHLKLLDIISPTHALVTNNGADHLEGFGSIKGARKANKEIYDWAYENEIEVFVNKNIADLAKDSENNNCLYYPSKDCSSNSSLYAEIIYDHDIFTSSLFGSYNEANILASIIVGEYFNVPREDILSAIKYYEPSLKRSQILELNGYKIILDCYNANPSSMELALRDFARTTSAGKRIFIIGDMFEMGQEENRVHREILTLVADISDNQDTVLFVGPRFSLHKENFPFIFFENTATAKEYFNKLKLEEKTVFLKGSRGIKLEEVIKEKVPLE